MTLPNTICKCSNNVALRSTGTGTSILSAFIDSSVLYCSRRSRKESRSKLSFEDELAVLVVRQWSVRSTRPALSMMTEVESLTADTTCCTSRITCST